MIRRFAGTIVALSAMTLASCTDSNPSQPQGSPLVGTWQVVSIAGSNASLIGASWTFTETRSTYTQALNGCESKFNYRLSGNKMISTVVQDGCVGSPAGEVDTLDYSVSGTNLTIRIQGTTIVLEKRAAPRHASLPGEWNVTTVDGHPPAAGRGLKLKFEGNDLTITASGPDGVCRTFFEYMVDLDHIEMATVEDECGNIEPGTEDTAHAVIDGNTLTMTFSDGTEMVAKKK